MSDSDSLRIRVEEFIRDNPGVSEWDIRRSFGGSGISTASRLYTDGILRSWRDDAVWIGSIGRVAMYRYAHVLTPRSDVDRGVMYETFYERHERMRLSRGPRAATTIRRQRE